ncbi:Lysine-rich nucleolar protein 1 [Camelus dromedarius]|uniref:Lysine-rich nucleolar protein 1 n=1 Tax=Camelus dromedarius TaxID=9838 RepID=A0A5N4CY96_CAMDR|nr:lysine-rich nucleolar protein 1 [Camelus dromedarius]XP_031288977.1 lysine-rich nucleolar protein 1 [Camelus dromedarius]XP_031288978.1 lysine-rich nucleolar protein 1 [Camelus dromedarius]KAB1263819.1 Lysine-rich nucleolar protein 1 [Camelus dromedarius]
MITKTQKGDLGLGLPEKKKKKKRKAVKEPETQYSALNSDTYSAEVCPTRVTSPSKNVVQGPAPEMPLVKKKKKKKKGHSTGCGEPLEPETTSRAGQTEMSPSPGKQVLGPSELSGEKKKGKRKSLSPGLRVKTSPEPRQGDEVTRVGKKLKKQKKEKKGQETTAISARDPWCCEAGDAPYTCSVVKDGEEQAALGQKRKQGSSKEHSMKMKKKKKIHQEGDTPLGHPKLSMSVESSSRKRSKKKPIKVEAPEYIPLGDGPRTPAKKKMKSKKKAEHTGIEESILKRKKKKKKKKKQESRAAAEPWEEEPDTDLEVVLEKKGNMDETHIDQVRRKALQEEIDRESGKTEASDTKKWTGTQFGQWDTAGFANEEQKLKFLKLMGGFKNLSPSFSRPPSTTRRPNMALSKKAADTLQQNLQQDYDRALSWKASRGAGLGFAPAPGKVFYIDRNASKSIKFED